MHRVELIDSRDMENAKLRYFNFINACRKGETEFGLTPRAEPTAFGRCFAVFGLHLIRRQDCIIELGTRLTSRLRDDIRDERARFSSAPTTKSYRQLLTFTLSALAALQALDEDPLADLVLEQVPDDIDKALAEIGSLNGKAQSGNQAMFIAVFLLHARDMLGMDIGNKLERWIDLHLASMNKFGFWGADTGMQHLLFQNGYHQYEILEYLGQSNPRVSEAVGAVRKLADSEGHFAPYPGGGGCFDYDAVFVLTPDGVIPDLSTEVLLQRIITTLMAEQTSEGGWAESHYIRPRSLRGFMRFVTHAALALPNVPLFIERSRYALALQRSRYNRIHTHWSRYSRGWDEADLWDSWFRLLAVARIQVAREPERAAEWGFIDFPGIGYHPSLSAKF